jgi:hypothetical protein
LNVPALEQAPAQTRILDKQSQSTRSRLSYISWKTPSILNFPTLGGPETSRSRARQFAYDCSHLHAVSSRTHGEEIILAAVGHLLAFLRIKEMEA